ncbi:MAG: superoxide dismutase family protein [Rhizobacter sp.]|nr:superoxide dismutase family protein [Rhizobacter sp.]
MSTRPVLAAAFAIAAAALASCAGAPGSSSSPGTASSSDYVVASLKPTRGNSAAGTVWFSQEGGDVLMRGRVTGLVPNQEHGFHVHEKGDCSSDDAMSAGGHLNPGGKRHGPPSGEHHAGDLPAIKADANGVATVRVRVSGTLIGAGAQDIAGKALVVHAAPDDYTTQPTGNSGARIACGVIGVAAGRDAAGNPVAIPKDL